MRAILLCSLLLFATLSSLTAQDRREVPSFETFGSAPSQNDANEIDELLAEFRDSWGAQDVDRLIALHSEDVEWINAYARIFRGREALRTFLEDQLFPQWDASVSVQEAEGMTPISLRYVGRDAAVAHWYTDGDRGASRTGDDPQRRTHITLVLERRETGWRIVHEAIFDAR